VGCDEVFAQYHARCRKRRLVKHKPDCIIVGFARAVVLASLMNSPSSPRMRGKSYYTSARAAPSQPLEAIVRSYAEQVLDCEYCCIVSYPFLHFPPVRSPPQFTRSLNDGLAVPFASGLIMEMRAFLLGFFPCCAQNFLSSPCRSRIRDLPFQSAGFPFRIPRSRTGWKLLANL
jgi:hypothetical protein